jgi:hypothetical protein
LLVRVMRSVHECRDVSRWGVLEWGVKVWDVVCDSSTFFCFVSWDVTKVLFL